MCDIFQVAKCFGFQVPPFVDLAVGSGERPKKRGGGGGLGEWNKQRKKAKLYRRAIDN